LYYIWVVDMVWEIYEFALSLLKLYLTISCLDYYCLQYCKSCIPVPYLFVEREVCYSAISEVFFTFINYLMVSCSNAMWLSFNWTTLYFIQYSYFSFHIHFLVCFSFLFSLIRTWLKFESNLVLCLIVCVWHRMLF